MKKWTAIVVDFFMTILLLLLMAFQVAGQEFHEWLGAGMPVLNFIDRHNLSGKKIVLFCSHGTGGLAGSVEDITAELPSDCAIEENVIGIYRDDIPSGQSEIKKWLKEIGY